MTEDYRAFLATKRTHVEPVGFIVPEDEINPMLFDWQRAITRWALARGRAALFLDTGLGKTAIQLTWAEHVIRHVGGRVLILAPLAVSYQTAREAAKFKTGVDVTVCKTADDVRDGINITNYERLHHFQGLEFTGIVLDESSILKSYSSKVRQMLTDYARGIRYRLACTATPAPNDLIELVNHAEFLSIMKSKEIIALFFRSDGNNALNWVVKGHAKESFWKWMAEWSVAVRRPSDIGYDDDRFILPEINRYSHVVSGRPLEGALFVEEARTMDERRRARRESIRDRVELAAKIVAEHPDDTWLVWCDLNAESEALTKAIPGAVEVRGSDTPEHKESSIIDFTKGNIRVLVSKPTICGFGMNFQHCHRMVFVGLSDSFEQLYQATRRCWRFGQTSPVDVHVVTADSEGAVVRNIERKERQAEKMYDEIVANMSVHELVKTRREERMRLEGDVRTGENWTLHLGDSCEVLKQIETDSVGLSVFSPPFPGMYAFTNTEADIGNSKSIEELINHFEFLVPELLRVTMPGRSCCVHLTQEKLFKKNEGYFGLRDFRGDLIRLMQRYGWIYASERTIDKDPQLRAIRTRDHGLAMRTAATDASVLSGTMPDYLIQFKKKGDNPLPIRALRDHKDEKRQNKDGWITQEDWIQWASAVWYGYHRIKRGGIRETDVLEVRSAKDNDDEKHLCPLQLGVIERCIKLWSAPGDLVLDPFTGVGSTPYMAVRLGRKALGIELKRSYWEVALQNIERARIDACSGQQNLFEVEAACGIKK